MGRNRLSDEIKKQRGTLEKSRINKNQPLIPKIFDLQSIKIPTHLNKYSKVFFKKYAELLIENNVITISDLESLEVLSSEYGKYIEAQHEIKKSGLIQDITNTKGFTYSVQSPWIQIANNAHKNYITMLAKFGLSPSDRSKIVTIKPKDSVDPLSEFFNDN
ncbi:hypothetical protein P872_18415 [Rhodonellum psychrophilum GCM71 = DSM 17998]|uniref:Terminase n=2 Tax=Rhodonellum TaxID=336827 RepID=U5C2I9_9BACT|nr:MULTISPECIES: phage terminase small subunit P27 family [Rhodonellum]ERM82372.1 hypothetical protein P872_18415 [Rhodonellum psychrophilum GCM71 = DSM 17998]SDZ35344.1 phage terminase, small subunit, putative, P27 family [Rhodonellum ikkaensis]